jgi:hypothetical protein
MCGLVLVRFELRLVACCENAKEPSGSVEAKTFGN